MKCVRYRVVWSLTCNEVIEPIFGRKRVDKGSDQLSLARRWDRFVERLIIERDLADIVHICPGVLLILEGEDRNLVGAD